MKIGGWLGKQWEQNKGTIAKVGSASLGLIPGIGLPLAMAAGAATAGVHNKSGAQGGGGGSPLDTEMTDLAKRRKAGLDSLEADWKNPYQAPLAPTPELSYDAPKSGQRDTQYLDKATAMQRPSGVIANDALDELRGRGEFNYADRAPENMSGDVLGEIKNFRGDAGDLAKQYAMQGYSGGPAIPGVTSRDVNGMTERADVSELMNFDPSAAFEKYVTGAQGQFNTTLGKANERLTNTAAGGNRLNTGFFDLDRGELGRQLSEDARNAMQQKALETNAQKLAAITSGSGIRADDLNSLRAQYLQSQEGNADRALKAGMSNAEIANLSANRDADFRAKALGQLGESDKTRLSALDTARGYQVGDVERAGKNFESDRAFKQNAFDTWNDTLGKVSTTQRADRQHADDIFNEDRAFNMGVDDVTGKRFEGDRDYDLAAWGASNEARAKGRAMNTIDRDYSQGVHDEATNKYLDFLSGASDRAQGAVNAREAAAAAKSAAKSSMWGDILGAGIGVAGDYLGSKYGKTPNTESTAWVKRQKPVRTTNNGSVSA